MVVNTLWCSFIVSGEYLKQERFFWFLHYIAQAGFKLATHPPASA